MPENNLESLRLLKEDCDEQLRNLETEVRDEAVERFTSSGGCESCRGRGWVVTWDTLDSMTGCYHESSQCKADGCTTETRNASGLQPVNNKYDNFHSSRWTPTYSEDHARKKSTLENEIARLSSEIMHEEHRWTPSPGKIAKVVKSGRGRKDRRVPAGVEGLIKKLHTNDWGTTKAILVDRDGKQWWPTLNQIEVIDPEPDVSYWEEMDSKQRSTAGFPLVATIKKKTARAILIRTTTAKEFWVPFSIVPEMKKVAERSTSSVMLPMWFAEKNGLVTKDG